MEITQLILYVFVNVINSFLMSCNNSSDISVFLVRSRINFIKSGERNSALKIEMPDAISYFEITFVLTVRCINQCSTLLDFCVIEFINKELGLQTSHRPQSFALISPNVVRSVFIRQLFFLSP